ncbi:MAG TPA: A/G-specific adenine glycosylase [Usitatibacter sp.]|nr:A/G-specific adenine glycosylase [Usitatibacter sp.]
MPAPIFHARPAADFAARIVRWQRAHGRSGLPWQGTRDAYAIWLSEVMLQQTQVATVVPYYERFVARFPDVRSLAAASVDDVLPLWSGLGYYARARNLHRAACEVMARFGGVFPTRFDDLVTLPGIGRSTAAAIAAFASGARHAILDGNVKRVLARHAGIGGDPASSAVLARLWAAAEALTPHDEVEAYTQGMMDLGADICSVRRPACLACPVAEDCVARVGGRIEELPGKRVRAAPGRRRIGMLVVVSQAEVLLEKRPASGIWGGLWSLPECGADDEPRAALARDWGLEAAAASAMPPFEHAFTHFTLEVAPWRLQLARTANTAFERPATWLALADIEGAALPSPIRRLLASVRATPD